MHIRHLIVTAAALALGAAPLAAQHGGHHHPAEAPAMTDTTARGDSTHEGRTPARPHDGHHATLSLGGGWRATGMAQVFPTITTGSPWRRRTLLSGGLYATQPAAMINVESPGSRLVLRTTLNFEAWTQRDGELTFGGWGEGFIDSRHPHTLLHEAVVSANFRNVAGGVASVSAGKGFAPYGTDDPMGRPAVKFPTNHHLSQIPERWLAGASYLRDGWSLEGAVFGGAEPEGPYDFRHIESFGDSWSARLAMRPGAGDAAAAPWELSASYAYVEEEHHGATAITSLYNVAARHEARHSVGTVYWLAEASRSDPRSGPGYFSVLTEAQLSTGRGDRHRPYARVEYATRPEYEREGAPGTPGFFRYEHGAHEIGATRWIVTTVGYGHGSGGAGASIRPFVEVQHNRVARERGAVDPRALFGDRHFWGVSAGARVFLGGGPMRMGTYGQFDPMSPVIGTRRAGATAPHAPH